jgi:hypothetical protein
MAEEKLHVGVREQRSLTTTGIEEGDVFLMHIHSLQQTRR